MVGWRGTPAGRAAVTIGPRAIDEAPLVAYSTAPLGVRPSPFGACACAGGYVGAPPLAPYTPPWAAT
jgi:hypothetical protein